MASKLPLLVLTIIAVLLPASDGRGFRATMVRTGKAIDFARAARQSRERLSVLAARHGGAGAGGRVSTQTPLRMHAGGGAYDMEFSIGTPPLHLSANADTGSDLVWLKCGGACAASSSSSCAPPPAGSPSYFPGKSSSFSKLPCSDSICAAVRSESRVNCSAGGTECDYRVTYGAGVTYGYLGGETFTLGGAAVPGVGFGCSTNWSSDFATDVGLVGLGRGAASLVSQLNVGAFSYCLTTDAAKASPLLFGSIATLAGAGVQATPLLPHSTYYVVRLHSITIGEVVTPGPWASGGAVVFDSGATLTLLTEPAYTLAKAAFLAQTALPRAAGRDGFELCFRRADNASTTSSDGGGVPQPMVLHFDGGADMVLPAANYLAQVDAGVACWVVQRSTGLGGVSIIGNIMQMGFHVRYDVDKSVLSFAPADCDSL